MNHDLGFSASVYGFGAGIFLVGYCLFEIPSNLILAKVGARRWISRIMISWGIVACAMMLIRGRVSFYTLRFLLGAAEAGFFPGMIFYLDHWFPAAERARADPELLLRILLIGYLYGITSERKLVEELRMHLAWRWFTGLGFDQEIPHHSTFSKNRHGRLLWATSPVRNEWDVHFLEVIAR
jgi:ACS family tartrate transporter-like MFS transporter